ncbi:MAG: hypothetical protein ACRD3Q_13245, partial [Terriglobales bacterium]
CISNSILEGTVNRGTGKRLDRISVPMIYILFVLGIGVGACVAQSAPAKLQAYALRGPQDSTAKLYLSVITDGSAPPAQLGTVTVSTVGAAGQPRQVGTYTNVDSPGGQATIDIGDVPLLAALTVHVKIGPPDSPEVLNATTAVSEFAVNPQSVVVPDFEGFGAQMNMHLYTALNDPTRAGYTGNTPPLDLPNVEQKVRDMHPGLSRIFLSPANYDPANQNRMDSFYQTVALAQSVGARVNITWWFLDHSTNATVQETLTQKDMQEFADTLADLVVNHHYTCIQEVTIQNEPSTTWLNQDLPVYQEAYQLLDQHLRDAGIRSQIKLIGGDMVFNNQEKWFAYMADNMGSLLDGWSVHIYWNYYQTWYMQQRLSDILAIYNSIDPVKRKPLSVTEYGVRGYKTVDGQTVKVADPYRSGALVVDPVGVYIDPDTGDTIPVNETNLAGFEQAWFNMQAADDGFIGFSKWDFYHAQYDFGYQDHSLIGYVFGDLAPGQDRWPLRPAYYMEWLMANTTGQHWQVLGTNGSSGAKLITPFRSPNGAQTIFAMSTDQTAADITIGNLSRGTEFNVLVWNADGSGTVTNAGTVNAGGNGTVTVHATASSMVALTTLPATGWRLCRSQGGPCVFGDPVQTPQ